MRRRFAAAALILALALTMTGCFGSSRIAEGITNTYEFDEPITGVEIETSSLDVEIVPSENGICTVVCQEADTLLHDVYVDKGILRVTRKKNVGGSVSINIPLKIRVSLPEGVYGDIVIETSSGDQHVYPGFRFANGNFVSSSGNIGIETDIEGSIRIKTSSGGQMVRGVSAPEIKCESTSGNIYAEELDGGMSYGFESTSGNVVLTGVVARGSLEAETTSGDILFTGCDAESITFTTSSGNVKGSLLTGKQFRVKTSSGRVSVPQDAGGEFCSVRTSSGDVSITLE